MLLAVDNGESHKYRGKSLDQISVHGKMLFVSCVIQVLEFLLRHATAVIVVLLWVISRMDRKGTNQPISW